MVRWANDAFRHLLELDETGGWPGPVRLPARASGFGERGRDVLAAGRPERVEQVGFLRSDGGPRRVTGILILLPNDGEVLAGGCFFDLSRYSDITDELDRLLVHTPVFVLCTDADLRYTWSAGQGVERLVGGPGLGRTAWEVVGTTDPEHPAISPLLSALEGRDARYRLKVDGMWLDNWVGPLREPGGRISGTIAVVVDSSEPAALRARERVAEERLRRLIDHSPALIGVRDEADRVVHANPAYLRTFDQSAGSRRRDVPRDGRADLTTVGQEVREHLRSRIWEGSLPHPGGVPVDLMGYVFPMPMVDGSTGVGEVFLDVTGQERSRRALAESEQRWRAVFDGVDLSIMLVDLNAHIIDANAASNRWTGRPRSELLGKFVGHVITRADIEAHTPMWNELVAGRRNRYDVSARLRHADGSLLPIRMTVTLIRDSTGKPVHALAMSAPMGLGAERMRAERVPSKAESDVLSLLAAGRSIAEIGRELGLTRRGVDYRIGQLRRKLRAGGPDGVPATTAALVARGYAMGLLVADSWPPRLSGNDGTG